MPPSPPLNVKWQTGDLCRALGLRTTGDIVSLPELAPIPSPVANLGAQEEACVALVDGTASPAVKALFHLVRNICNTHPEFREVMAGDEDGLAEDRKFGMLAYVDEAENAEDGVAPGTNWDTPHPIAKLRRVEDYFTLRIDAREPAYHLMPGATQPVVSRKTTPIDIRKMENATSDRRVTHGFFIVNLSKTYITINKLVIRPNRIAGPLPDFAVMEFGEAAAFWWHSRGARDYIPVKRLQARTKRARDPDPDFWEELMNLSEDVIDLSGSPLTFENQDPGGRIIPLELDQEGRNLEEDEDEEAEDFHPVDLYPEATSDQSWAEKLQRRLNGWRTAKALLTNRDKWVGKKADILQVGRDLLANSQAVSAAIAAITMGYGCQREFAYGSTSSFRQILESSRRPAGRFICDRKNPLLMPLWLQRDFDQIKMNSLKEEDVWAYSKSTSSMMLAVACRAPADAGFDVKIRIWNPQWQRLPPYFAQQDSITLVQNSDWIDDLPAETNLVFDVIHEPVPLVNDLTQASIHVVLTAWAYALDYPLSPLRSNVTYSDTFYADALELINLALAGCMDGTTIVTFFHANNYGAWYDGANGSLPEMQPELSVRARVIRGGLEAFDRLVERKFEVERRRDENEKKRKAEAVVAETRAKGKRKMAVDA